VKNLSKYQKSGSECYEFADEFIEKRGWCWTRQWLSNRAASDDLSLCENFYFWSSYLNQELDDSLVAKFEKDAAKLSGAYQVTDPKEIIEEDEIAKNAVTHPEETVDKAAAKAAERR
jgi:hypothetical protein